MSGLLPAINDYLLNHLLGKENRSKRKRNQKIAEVNHAKNMRDTETMHAENELNQLLHEKKMRELQHQTEMARKALEEPYDGEHH